MQVVKYVKSVIGAPASPLLFTLTVLFVCSQVDVIA